MINYEQIANIFVKQGWRWKIGFESVVPNSKDIQKTVEAAKKKLSDEPVGSQLSVGRLIIKKEASGFDVYLFMGVA